LMKLPSHMSHAQKVDVVEKVLMELGLRECADTRVGGDGSHPCISGGERRRVSIGVQMLTDPGILFLDEPTTGLDSFTANNLMGTLAAIAHNSYRSVICTVHQPRSDIFQLFDYVMLLSKGRVVYFGESREVVLNYFASIGYPCPDDMNPADYFLDLITVDTRNPDDERESMDRVNGLVKSFESTDQNLLNRYKGRFQTKQQEAILALGGTAEANELMGNRTPHPLESSDRISDFLLTWYLFRRLAINTYRNHALVASKLLEPLIMGFIVALIFYQMGSSLVDITSTVASLYNVSAIQPYLVLLTSVIQYCTEFLVFDREYSDKMIRAGPYFAAQMIISLFWGILTPLLFAVAFYFIADLRDGWIHFLWFYVLLGGTQYAMESLGFLCSCLIRDLGGASLIGNSAMTFWSLSCGYLVNPATFPFYLSWIAYTSPLQYGFAGLAENQFKDATYDCPVDDPNSPICTQFSGNYVLEALHLQVTGLWTNFAVLCLFGLFFRFLSYLLLRFYKQPPK